MEIHKCCRHKNKSGIRPIMKDKSKKHGIITEESYIQYVTDHIQKEDREITSEELREIERENNGLGCSVTR